MATTTTQQSAHIAEQRSFGIMLTMSPPPSPHFVGSLYPSVMLLMLMVAVAAFGLACDATNEGASYRYSNLTVSSAEKERSLRPGGQVAL
jgi:hypothetical protein